MFDNLLSKLPLLKDQDARDLDDDEEAEAKRERIQFHRDHVRNGPVKFNPPTSGQLRRERQRAVARSTKKARRKQVRDYFDGLRESSRLRAKLQSAGVIPFALPETEVSDRARQDAIVWIVERFAQGEGGQQIEVTETVVRDALQLALNRWQKLNGLPETELEGHVVPHLLDADA